MGVCGEQIFKKVYEEFVTPLQRYAIHRGHALEDASDIVQDAFVRLWNNCEKVELATVKSYLYTIISNLIIDRYRKKKIRLVPKQEHQDPSDHLTPHFELEQKEFKQRLEHFLNEMKDGPREVFLMHRMEGMSYKEIAETLKLSVKAIEKRMQKALEALYEAKLLSKK